VFCPGYIGAFLIYNLNILNIASDLVQQVDSKIKEQTILNNTYS